MRKTALVMLVVLAGSLLPGCGLAGDALSLIASVFAVQGVGWF
jgi:hypothetical protein